MPASNASPKKIIRKTVLSTYRARGKSINNIWLVYSPKTDSDWSLPSDRQLIHWLAFLETNSEVKSFDLDPDPVISHDNEKDKATIFDAVVTLQSGVTEYHEVKAGRNIEVSEQDRSQLATQLNVARKDNITYKRFNDIELEPQAAFAMRWLYAIGFASAIRGNSHLPTANALMTIVQDKQNGLVSDILCDMEAYDQAIVLGLLVRFSITGLVFLDLSKKTFGLSTPWIHLRSK
jgi:hypothetical protein